MRILSHASNRTRKFDAEASVRGTDSHEHTTSETNTTVRAEVPLDVKNRIHQPEWLVQPIWIFAEIRPGPASQRSYPFTEVGACLLR